MFRLILKLTELQATLKHYSIYFKLKRRVSMNSFRYFLCEVRGYKCFDIRTFQNQLYKALIYHIPR